MKLIIPFLILLIVSSKTFSQAPKTYDWLMIYYIPYDNNLDEYTDSIVHELEAGVGSNTMIAIFIDRYNHFDKTLNEYLWYKANFIK
jgi:hypothetical protein